MAQDTPKPAAAKPRSTKPRAAKAKAAPAAPAGVEVARSRFTAAVEEAKAGAAALTGEAKARAATLTGTAKERAAAYAGDARAKGEGYAGEARAKAAELAVEGKAKAGEALVGLSRVVDENAPVIDEKLGQKYGDYARSASRSLQSTADKLNAKSVEELGEDAREYVRQNPGKSLGIAVVAGYLLSRLFRR